MTTKALRTRQEDKTTFFGNITKYYWYNKSKTRQNTTLSHNHNTAKQSGMSALRYVEAHVTMGNHQNKNGEHILTGLTSILISDCIYLKYQRIRIPEMF